MLQNESTGFKKELFYKSRHPENKHYSYLIEMESLLLVMILTIQPSSINVTILLGTLRNFGTLQES